MRRRIRLNKRLVYVILGFICAIAALIFIYKIMHHLELRSDERNRSETSYSEMTLRDTRERVYYDGKAYALKDGITTYLLIGLDKIGDNGTNPIGNKNTQQNDFNLLMVFDNDANTCKGIHLNRDTMTQIRELDLNGVPAESYLGQLALAHTYGTGSQDSCKNVVYSVSELLYGVPVNHYLSMTMDGIAVLNDAVGGVTVNVTDDFSAVTDKLPMNQSVTLTGELALIFVRARGSMPESTNLNRMNRQKVYLEAFYDCLKNKVSADDGFALDTLLKVNDALVSDCTVNELSELLNKIGSIDFEGIVSPQGEAKVGEEYMEFYTDEKELTALVIEMFYEQVSD